MAHNGNTRNHNEESSSTVPEPVPERWYNLALGSSFQEPSSAKFCTLRYEFKPASIDKNRPGSLHKNKDNRISVEFHNNQQGRPKWNFEGSSENYKGNDAVLLFDGESFRLERLHRAVKRLRNVTPAPSVGPAPESGSSPIGKGAKFQSSTKNVAHSLPVEVERIDVGDSESLGAKAKNEKAVDLQSSHQNLTTASPKFRPFDLEEPLDIVNDDDDIFQSANKGDVAENEFHTGIDINMPHQNDSDDEIADVDVSDNELDKGRNAAEALRAQVNAEGKEEHSTSSADSSASESSGSESSASSSSDSESSDSDSVNSI